MRILFLDPFHGGSHAAVAEGYAAHSRHEVTLLTLSQTGGWRWRMRGAAVTLARQTRELMRTEGTSGIASSSGPRSSFDLIVATDMLDLATFLGLTRDITARIPVALYFHENQLTYPLPAGRKLDLSFPWINYTSALAADMLCFNSDFHRRAFLEALPGLVGRFHDHRELDLLPMLEAKAHVLPPGIDLKRLDTLQGDQETRRPGDQETSPNTLPISPSPCLPVSSDSPVILWNSRWEYDKQPATFFEALAELEARGVDFRVIVIGEHIDPQAPDFVDAHEKFGSRALAWGYAADLETYRRRLWQADIVVSTAIQEFFGISVIEAMYCGCVPILPQRLSYPELLPQEFHSTCLYNTFEELVDKLQAAIEHLPALRQRWFGAVAAHFDWSQMASHYDDLFERAAQAAR
jgi:glycosyltransferase involved in cell wall biosynthesis